MFDGAAFGREIVATVKSYLERALEPVLQRLTALETEVPKQINAAVFNLVDVENVEMLLQALPKPQDGKDADFELVAPVVEETVNRVLSGWERPQNGIDGKDGVSGRDGIDGKDGRDGVDGAPGAFGAPGRDGRDGVDGKGVDMDMIGVLVKAEVARLLDGWERPKDGRDGRDGTDGKDGADGKEIGQDQVIVMVAAETERVLATWERPQDGRDGRDGVDGIDGVNGKDGRDGIDGKSVDIYRVLEMVKIDVATALEEWPRPKDGRDGIDGKDGRDGIDGVKGEPGLPGLNGIGATGAFQDRDGNLVITMNDGSVANVGRVQGPPGTDGKDGRNGKDGQDGRDGFGFEDMNEELDSDGRTVIRRYARGEEVKEFKHVFDVVLDRGVWKETTYQRGDCVSWGGQLYIAQKETSTKPLTPEATDDWRLAVKKGRDGKDGIVRTVNDKPIVKVVK
jgi:hypothetical protein